MGFGFLTLDLTQHILSFMPLKQRTRVKLVCKDWYDMITMIRESAHLKTSYGLVIVFDKSKAGLTSDNEANFITLTEDDDDDSYRSDNVLVHSLRHNFPNYILVSSCNGLLLYAKTPKSCYREFMVYNPTSKQRLSIPWTRCPSQGLYVGFFYDDTKKQFKIMCLGVQGFFQKRCTKIFSSETWEWSEHNENPSISKQNKYGISNCYCSEYGMIYLIGRRHLTIFDIEKNLSNFDCIAAPYYIDGPLRFAWVSDGKLWGCFFSKIVIKICVCQEDGRWKCTDSIHAPRWVYVVSKTIPRSILRIEKRSLQYYKAFEPKPVSFNEELQTLYFKLPGKVFGYSLETKELTLVWFDPRHGHLNGPMPNNIIVLTAMSFLYKPVDTSHFDETHICEFQRKKTSVFTKIYDMLMLVSDIILVR